MPFGLRCYGGSTGQASGSGCDTHCSPTVRNPIRDHRDTTGRHDWSADADHNASSGTGNDSNSSEPQHPAGDFTSDNNTSDNNTCGSGYDAAGEYAWLRHARCHRSLYNRSDGKRAAKWIYSDQQFDKPGRAFFAVNARTDDTDFAFQSNGSGFTGLNVDRASARNYTDNTNRVPSGNGP